MKIVIKFQANVWVIWIKRMLRQVMYFVLFKSMWNRKNARSIHLLSEISEMLSMQDQTKKKCRQVEIVGDFFLWRLKKYDDNAWVALANENRRCLIQHFNIQVDENHKKWRVRKS